MSNENGSGRLSNWFGWGRDSAAANRLDEPIEFPRPSERGPSDGSNGRYLRDPGDFGSPLWRVGWTDGRAGLPVEGGTAVIEARVAEQRREQLAEIEEILGAAEAERNRAAERLSRAREAEAKAEERRTEVAPPKGSWLAAGAYLLTSLILLIADIPLSLSIVSEGFRLPTVADIPGFGPLDVGQLLQHPFLVFQHFWEAIVLALGIAFAPLYFKYFVDEVLDLHVEKPIRGFWKLVVPVPVFVLLTVTLILLGFFRADQQRINLALQEAASLAALGATGTGLPAIEDSQYGTLTFVFICVTLPLVGALCFARGARFIEERSRFRQIERGAESASERSDRAAEHLGAAEQSLELHRLRKAQLQSSTGPSHEASLYQHGYHRGRSAPETAQASELLHVRIGRLAERLLAIDGRQAQS